MTIGELKKRIESLSDDLIVTITDGRGWTNLERVDVNPPEASFVQETRPLFSDGSFPDWIPLEGNWEEFTRLCRLKKCQILHENEEIAFHHEGKRPFSVSTHFREMTP